MPGRRAGRNGSSRVVGADNVAVARAVGARLPRSSVRGVQVLEIRSLDGPDGFAAAERPDPDPDGRVVIDVRAAGVSFPDLLISQGRYQVKAELPWVPGQEVAGVVRSAPAGHVLRSGDRAWG